MNNYHQPIITITTDFQGDYSSAQVEGVIRSLAPEAIVVRATDQVHPFDIREGQFVLWDLARFYPAEAVHIGVIDPGVGTEREIIALETGCGTFVGPDNGLFDTVAERFGVKRCRRYPIGQFVGCSTTFHGRDVFTRIAVDVATGSLGLQSQAVDYTRRLPEPQNTALDTFTVIHIDGFGNLKLDRLDSPAERGFVETHDSRHLYHYVETFHRAGPGDLVAYVGSSELLELAVVNQSAQRFLDVEIGQELRLRTS